MKRMVCLLLIVLLVACVAAPTVGALSGSEASGNTEEHPYIGRRAKFTVSYPYLWNDANINDQKIADANKLPAVVRIVDVYVYSKTVTLYKLEAADGSAWPEAYEGYYYVESTKVELLPEPSISATVTDANGNEQTVTVTGDALPDGATLNVAPIANELAVMAELNMEGGFLWDIKVFDANGNEWQPAEGLTVKLTLPVCGAPDGSTVNIVHVLDSVPAIQSGVDNGSIFIESISHLSETIRRGFAKEIAASQEASGRTDCAATEYFNGLSVCGGYVTFNTGSFSVYTWNNGFSTSTAGSSTSNRIVFNANNSHNGSNGRVFYIDSYANSTSSVFLDCGGSGSFREWFISSNGSNFNSKLDGTCVVDATQRPFEYRSIIYNDTEFKVGSHENVYAYGNVFWVRCIIYGLFGGENSRSTVKFVVISDRNLTYDANGVSCTLPSASSWKSTYWGSPTSDKVGSDAHVAPSTIKIGKPSNIQGNYHFLYWENTDSYNVNVIYYPSDSYSPSLVAGGLHLRAKWARYYKVTLDAQNGSGDSDGTKSYWYLYNTTKVVNSETVYYWKNQDCTTPLSNYKIEIPTKYGHTFGGYYTGKNGTGTQYVDKNGICVNNLYTAKAEDSTLYAYWIPNPNAVIYQYTGTIPTNAPAAPAQKTYNYGSSVSTEPVPGLTGYTFSGWTTSNATVSNGVFTMPNNAVTFIGYWTLNEYNLTFNYSGGSVATANPGSYNVESNAFTLVNPTREGYTFVGWTGTGLSGTVENVTIAKGSTGNRTYTAVWQPNIYKVTLDKNGGSGGTDCYWYLYQTKVEHGQPNVGDGGFAYYYTDANCTNYMINGTGPDRYYHVNIPSRNGYTFGGYWTGANGTGIQYVDASGMCINDIYENEANNPTLIAYWIPITYTITYHLEGGNAVNPETYTIESGTITLMPPTKAGCVFKGWTGTGITGDPVATVAIPAGSVGDRVYYAVWEYGTVDLTIVANGVENGQSVIFTVTNLDSPQFVPIKVILTEENQFTVKIVGVPVGTYAVNELNEWSWRVDQPQNPDGQTGEYVIVLSQPQSVEFTFPQVSQDRWLTGCSYKKRRKGEI